MRPKVNVCGPVAAFNQALRQRNAGTIIFKHLSRFWLWEPQLFQEPESINHLLDHVLGSQQTNASAAERAITY